MKQSCDTIEDDGKEKIEALHALKKLMQVVFSLQFFVALNRIHM